MFPATISAMPAMNWQTPPKKINTLIKRFGVVSPRAWTPKMEIRKIPALQYHGHHRSSQQSPGPEISRRTRCERKEPQRRGIGQPSMDSGKRRLSSTVHVPSSRSEFLEVFHLRGASVGCHLVNVVWHIWTISKLGATNFQNGGGENGEYSDTVEPRNSRPSYTCVFIILKRRIPSAQYSSPLPKMGSTCA